MLENYKSKTDGRIGRAPYNVKYIKYKGKNYTAKNIAMLEESEISSAVIRGNINKLLERVEAGEVKYSDEEVLKCLKRIRSPGGGSKKKKVNKEKQTITDLEDWDLLNSLMR